MAVESVRSVRNNFADFIGRVQLHHERVTITKNGTAAAVLFSPEDLDSMEETIAILSEPGARAELDEAEESILKGEQPIGIPEERAPAAEALKDGRAIGDGRRASLVWLTATEVVVNVP